LGILDKVFKRKEKPQPSPIKGVHLSKLQRGFTVVEEYYVHKPFARIKIVRSRSMGAGLYYFIEETPMSEEEEESYNKIMGILSKEMEPPEDDSLTPSEYVQEQAEIIAEKYYRALGGHTKNGWNKIFYYAVKNIAGYGPLHAIMLDPNIEDISNNGLNAPVYVWHRKHESIPTNVTFMDDQVSNDYIVKLAHRSSKHISSATPMFDGMLPEKHRIAATFMNEVSLKGSTFCIRKFKEDPFSIADLIDIGTIDTAIAAYFWLILEHKMSFMIVGGTGAGKTSMLNGLLSLMSKNDKIVTVEEVPELSPPLPNWTQLHSRQSFQFGDKAASSISIFDLVKVSLRYRPDYIIVGEIRGEEAFTLFQALATGHGGLCTMHADSLTNVIKRLTSPPMNVSKVYIPLMNSALHIQRVELPKPRNGLNFGRRIRTVWEIEDFEQYREVAVWNPRTDAFDTWFENSVLLERIALVTGRSREALFEELELRRKFLQEIVETGVRDQKKVSEMILGYQHDQNEEPKPSHSKKKRQKKKKRITSSVVDEKEESDVLQPIARDDYEIILPQDIMQHETIEQKSPPNPLEGAE
jgi:flagellar protein FlaI